MGKIGKLFKRANEIAEGYQEVRDEEFDEQFKDFISNIVKGRTYLKTTTEEEIQGFLDSFDEDYPLETNWSWDEANAELNEIGDQQMELAKDKEIGI